jgi:dihydrolipoamide dehydrogenase
VDLSGFDYGAVFKKSREAAERLSRGVQFLLKKNNVALIEGKASFEGPHELSVVQPNGGERRSLSGRRILIATGSRSKNIPGFPVDEKRVLSSTGALMLERLPRKAVVLGAGAIGMEFAYIWSSFGVEVTVVEMLDQVLPLEDEEVSKVVAAAFKKAGTTILTGTAAKGLSVGKDSVSVSVSGKNGEKSSLEADLVLVAVGRTPNTEELNLERVGIGTVKGFIPVGDFYMTAVEGIYACGDVVASPLLAHVASKEGEIAVCHMAGRETDPKLDPLLIPSCVYCRPEVGSFGLSEREAARRGVSFEKAFFPYRGIGKAAAVEESDGFVKLLIDPETHEILGAHIVGEGATEIIHELLLAKKAELLPEDIAEMVHAHPTISEGVMEAARGAEGWQIHA